MLRGIILTGVAVATLSVPVAADAQYYGHTYGSYGHGRHYYWDGRHYRDRDNNAVLDTIIGGLIGYAVGSASNRSYGYAYPSYGYSYPYGYSSSYYSYPSYGYRYQNTYPGYGYYNNCYGYRC